MIYVVHRKTKEHRVATPDLVLPWEDWEFLVADADGWIEWDANSSEECPLPEDSPVEVKRRGPDLKVMKREGAARLAWQDIGSDFTITAYRPILDAKPVAKERKAPMPEQGTDTTTPRRPFLYSGRMWSSKPEPPTWDGEELPPVGARVEVEDGCKGTVLAAANLSRQGARAWLELDDGDQRVPSVECIRPIRSEEDRAMSAIEEAYMEGAKGHIGGLKAIYHAIRDGKVPGVKLENP